MVVLTDFFSLEDSPKLAKRIFYTIADLTEIKNEVAYQYNIAKELGVSIPSTIDYVKKLENLDLVRKLPKQIKGGRAVQGYEINFETFNQSLLNTIINDIKNLEEALEHLKKPSDQAKEEHLKKIDPKKEYQTRKSKFVKVKKLFGDMEYLKEWHIFIRTYFYYYIKRQAERKQHVFNFIIFFFELKNFLKSWKDIQEKQPKFELKEHEILLEFLDAISEVYNSVEIDNARIFWQIFGYEVFSQEEKKSK